jgi:branched-chain amino acid transport system permease protein
VSLEQVAQLTAAGIINGSSYALVGAGFGLILGVTGRFHYAFALVFTFAAYVTSVLETSGGLAMPLAVAGGLFAAVALGTATERFVYRPLARASGALSLLTIFISSLGVTIAGINLITLAWTAFSRSIELLALRPLNLGAISFTNVEAVLVVISWLLILALSGLLSFSDLGRSIRAARGNPQLARTLGLNPDTISCGCSRSARCFAARPAFSTAPVLPCNPAWAFGRLCSRLSSPSSAARAMGRSW